MMNLFIEASINDAFFKGIAFKADDSRSDSKTVRNSHGPRTCSTYLGWNNDQGLRATRNAINSNFAIAVLRSAGTDTSRKCSATVFIAKYARSTENWIC